MLGIKSKDLQHKQIEGIYFFSPVSLQYSSLLSSKGTAIARAIPFIKLTLAIDEGDCAELSE